jgi:hypothetical protein
MRTARRTALKWFLLAGTGAVLAGILCWVWHSRAAPPRVEPGITSRPAAEVFASFREALRDEDSDVLEAVAIDICGRRLLANMTRDEIVGALGKPTSLRWTPLDPKKGEADLVTRFLAIKADYYVYAVYDPDRNENTGLGLAFYGSRLAWSMFERGTDLELKRKIWTDYSKPPASAPSSRSATSEPSTQPDG